MPAGSIVYRADRHRDPARINTFARPLRLSTHFRLRLSMWIEFWSIGAASLMIQTETLLPSVKSCRKATSGYAQLDFGRNPRNSALRFCCLVERLFLRKLNSRLDTSRIAVTVKTGSCSPSSLCKITKLIN